MCSERGGPAGLAVRAVLLAMDILCGDCERLGECPQRGSVRECEGFSAARGGDGDVRGEHLARLAAEAVQDDSGADLQFVRILRG